MSDPKPTDQPRTPNPDDPFDKKTLFDKGNWRRTLLSPHDAATVEILDQLLEMRNMMTNLQAEVRELMKLLSER